MTAEMLAKSRGTAAELGLDHVEFREGLAEALPVEDGWADVVISNGVFNLCPDKRAVFTEVWRVLRPGGVLQFADIANGTPSRPRRSPDRPVDRLNCRWPAVCRLDPVLTDIGFVDVDIGGGGHLRRRDGEANARTFDVNGYSFLARKPATRGA